MFGKDLLKDLKSELSGDFDKVIRSLCLPHADFDATELRNAIKVSKSYCKCETKVSIF